VSQSSVRADIWVGEYNIDGARFVFFNRVYSDGKIRLAWRSGDGPVRVGAVLTEASPTDSLFIRSGDTMRVAIPRRVWSKLPALGLQAAYNEARVSIFQQQRDNRTA